MLSSLPNIIFWDAMLSSGAIMISSGTKCYNLGLHVIIWDEMLSSEANIIIWDEMLLSGMKCHYLG